MKKNADSATKQKKFLSSLFDTVKVKVRVKHKNLFLLKQQRPKRIIYTDRQYKVRGRFKGTFAIVGSADRGESLYIEASIPKFLTGQNLVGHEDLRAGAIELIDEVLRRARIQPTLDEVKAYRAGDFELLRVDYANHLWCGSAERAEHFMAALRRFTSAKAWEYSAYHNETLYWRQHSSRQTLKGYDKGKEIQVHPIGRRVRFAEVLSQKAVGLIRFEITLRADELKRLGLRDPAAWSAEVARRMLDQKVMEVVPTEGLVPDESLLSGLPRSLRDRLELWLLGGATAFTRYPGALAANKRMVLAAAGIDITRELTLAEQARAVMSFRDVFSQGWHYKCWKENWKKMRQGSME